MTETSLFEEHPAPHDYMARRLWNAAGRPSARNMKLGFPWSDLVDWTYEDVNKRGSLRALAGDNGSFLLFPNTFHRMGRRLDTNMAYPAVRSGSEVELIPFPVQLAVTPISSEQKMPVVSYKGEDVRLPWQKGVGAQRRGFKRTRIEQEFEHFVRKEVTSVVERARVQSECARSDGAWPWLFKRWAVNKDADLSPMETALQETADWAATIYGRPVFLSAFAGTPGPGFPYAFGAIMEASDPEPLHERIKRELFRATQKPMNEQIDDLQHNIFQKSIIDNIVSCAFGRLAHQLVGACNLHLVGPEPTPSLRILRRILMDRVVDCHALGDPCQNESKVAALELEFGGEQTENLKNLVRSLR